MSFQILDPSAESQLPLYELAPRLHSLRGKTIWFLDNQGEQWGQGPVVPNPIFRTWMEHLEQVHGVVTPYACTEQFTSPYRHGHEMFERVVHEADAVVVGLACCGSGTSAVIHDAIQFERRAIPTVALITDNVVPFARATALKLGIADLPFLTVSHKIHAFAAIASTEDCRAVAASMFDRVVASLARG